MSFGLALWRSSSTKDLLLVSVEQPTTAASIHTISVVIAKRKMAPGVPDIEGSSHGHDVIPVKGALKYFEKRGYPAGFGADILNNIKPYAFPYLYIGSSKELGANRVVFGEAVNLVLDKLSKEEAAKKVMVIDSACVTLTLGVPSFIFLRLQVISRARPV